MHYFFLDKRLEMNFFLHQSALTNNYNIKSDISTVAPAFF